MPRLVRGCQPRRAVASQRGTRAQYSYERWEKLVILLLCTIVRVQSVQCARWQNAYNSGLQFGAFFYFIYVKLDVIHTCVQIFKKIDRKKRTFFIWKFGAMFVWQTVHWKRRRIAICKPAGCDLIPLKKEHRDPIQLKSRDLIPW